jgi:hypothetical protein
MKKIKIILKEKEFPNLVIKNEVKVLIDENINWKGLPYSELTAFCPLEYQKEVNIEHEVISITSENFNSKIQQKIQNGLDAFNKDLDEFWWKNMEEVKNRLNDDWVFYTIEDSKEIVSWVWYDPNRSISCNQYTLTEYRNKGLANSISLANTLDAKRFGKKEIYGNINEWNLPQMEQLKKSGWVELQPGRITKEKYEERIEYDKNEISK